MDLFKLSDESLQRAKEQLTGLVVSASVNGDHDGMGGYNANELFEVLDEIDRRRSHVASPSLHTAEQEVG